MKRYFKYSLKRMLAQLILESELKEFSHEYLMEQRDIFAYKVPHTGKVPNTNKQLHYQLMSEVRNYLLEEYKKTLITIRGKGYKIADDPEKHVESFGKLVEALKHFSKGYKITLTIEPKNLDDKTKEAVNIVKTYLNMGSNLIKNQVLKDLRNNNLLPLAIEKKLDKLK